MLRILGAFAAVCALFLLLIKSCEEEQEPTLPILLEDLGKQRHNKPSHILGNLSWGDTLILNAQFAECGEWGGHREQIRVYLPAKQRPQAGANFMRWRKGPLEAAWCVDSVKCSYKPGHKYVVVQRRRIDVADERQLEQYLQQLLVCSLQEKQGFGGPAFGAELGEDLQLSCYWQPQHMHDFGALRDHLFHR